MTESQEQALHSHLQRTASLGKAARWCVVGAGHGGLCLAGHLGLMGYEVSLYNRTDEPLAGVRWQGGVMLSGAVEGFGPVSLATSDIGRAVAHADIIMVVTPATAHRALATAMAPHLKDGQIIILNPGRTGGALELRQVFQSLVPQLNIVVGEAQTFLYASRAISRTEGRIFKIKNAVPLATLPACWIPDTLRILNDAFPSFVAGNNVLSTSLENIGAVFHPALTLMNAGWIEATGGNFEYYLQGITPTIARMLEQVDAERIAVATALGLQSVSAREWLYRSYDSPGFTLHEAIHNTGAYSGIKAPPTIAHRYISEDVPMSLVPMSEMGRLFGIPTPTIDLVIQLASMVHGCDYRARGRTVEHMGIANLSIRQIQQLAVGVAVESQAEMILR